MKPAIFGPIWTQFRSKQLKIWPGSHFCSWFDLIELIRSSRLNKKWLPSKLFLKNGQFLPFMVQIRPKMAKIGMFWHFPRPKYSNNFAKIFVIFSKFRKIENSEFSKHYKKMTLKLNFKNCEKLVPSRIPTQKFQFKFGMQGLNLKT